jgi:hypothetical protein
MSLIGFVTGVSERKLTTVSPHPKINLIHPEIIQMRCRRPLLVLVIGNMFLRHENSEYVKVV